MTAGKTAGPEERLGGDRKINRPGDRLPSDRTTGMVVARAFTAWWTGVRFPPAPQQISPAQRHYSCHLVGLFLPVFYPDFEISRLVPCLHGEAGLWWLSGSDNSVTLGEWRWLPRRENRSPIRLLPHCEPPPYVLESR